MKTKLMSLLLGLSILTSCSNIEDEAASTGTIELKCGVNTSVQLKSTSSTVDPNDFVVQIKDSKDAVVNEFDPFSSAPDQLELIAGTYTVEAYSEEFTTPAFEMPVYGADVQVSVEPGQNKTVALNCTQTNAGVKFLWTDDFKTTFTEYSAKVKQSSNTIDFTKTEERAAYFPAGDITIDITVGEAPDQTTYSKIITLNPRELVTIKAIASDAGSGTMTISITVDTDVTEREEIFIIGTGGSGGGSGVTSLDEDFETGTNYDAANINGWTVAKVLGDRDWQIRTYSSNNYAQASAHNGASADYEYWLITPAIDMDNATNKIMTFETAKAYWNNTSSLEVFVMDGIDPSSANVTSLSVTLAQESDADNAFIPSGNVDLSSQTGIKYIGFKYVAQGGSGNSTTFRIDNFKFGAESSSGGTGGNTGTEILFEDFATASGGTVVDASGSLWDGGDSFTSTDRVYQAAGTVKIGSSSSAGSMMTKELDLSVNGGDFTVSFKTRGWYPEDNSIVVEVGGVEKTVSFTSSGKEGDMVDVSVDFTDGQVNSTITIKTTTRVYNSNTVTQRVFVDDFKVTETN